MRNWHRRGAVLLWGFICLFTFIITMISVSTAEDRSRKEFWINKYGEIRDGAYFARAREVFNHVLAASDKRVGVDPALHIINFDGTPWAQSLADGSIILTRNAIDFCYKKQSPAKGDARLAFVIGHELAHQFNGDFWEYKFLRSAEGDKGGAQAFHVIKELAKDSEMLFAKEIQADQYGIIYATLAGYNSDEIVLKDESFFLQWAKKEDPGNSSRDDLLILSEKRAKAVSIRLKEVADRVALYQLGVISYHIGRYDDALSLFSRFASYFPGREVYSNIGTVYLRKAYDKFLQSRTHDSFPFLLSFGVDPKTRAEAIDIARGFDEDKYREYKRLAELSIENLKKTTEYDPSYLEAKNSLGCAYIIQNKYYDAVSILEEALRLAPNNWKVRNNLAVAYVLLGQTVGSRDLLMKAEEILTAINDDHIAKSNLDAMLFMEGKIDNLPAAVNIEGNMAQNVTIAFKPSGKLRPGAKIVQDNYLIMVEEISSRGRGALRILQSREGKILLLTKNGVVHLALYKKPFGLKTNFKNDNSREIYVAREEKKGIIFSKKERPDFFEF